MSIKFTEFQRPDPNTEYEEIDPILLVSDESVTIIDKDGPIQPRTVVCCTCQGNITLCNSENTPGAFTTEYVGGILAFTIG